MEDEALNRGQARLLRRAMEHAELELVEVWVRYSSLGGKAEQFELEAYLHHALTLAPVERDILAQAVNELIDHREVLYAPYTCDLIDSHIADYVPHDALFKQEGQGSDGTGTA